MDKDLHATRPEHVDICARNGDGYRTISGSPIGISRGRGGDSPSSILVSSLTESCGNRTELISGKLSYAVQRDVFISALNLGLRVPARITGVHSKSAYVVPTSER